MSEKPFFTAEDFGECSNPGFPVPPKSLLASNAVEIANTKVAPLMAEIAQLWGEVARLKKQLEPGDKVFIENARLRHALIEIKGMLSAHEHAIRADAGNTNWQCMSDRVREALGDGGMDHG